MRAAMSQARKLAYLAAIGQLQCFLGIQMRRQRCRIGFFAVDAQRLQHAIKQAAHFRGISRLAVLRRQQRPVVHRVEQTGEHEGGENHRRSDTAGAAADPRPGRAQMRPGAGISGITRNGRNQQPDQRISPQQLEAEQKKCHEKRTRGSTSV